MNEVGVPTVPGTMLLAGVSGSTAYGLATPASDRDLLGLFAAPTNHVLGLQGPRVVEQTVVRSAPDPDAAVHEVGKFIRLVLRSNPTASELLWLPSYVLVHELGQLILDVRESFLSGPCVLASYGGYAQQQAKRALAHTPGDAHAAKPARHAVRLLEQGTLLLATGRLEVNCAARREELFAAGELAVNDPEAYMVLFTALLKQFEQTETVLPDEADTDGAEDLLVTIRRALLT